MFSFFLLFFESESLQHLQFWYYSNMNHNLQMYQNLPSYNLIEINSHNSSYDIT